MSDEEKKIGGQLYELETRSQRLAAAIYALEAFADDAAADLAADAVARIAAKAMRARK